MNAALVIRTDFSDRHAWDRICADIQAPQMFGFMANVELVDDPQYAALDLERSLDRIAQLTPYGFAMIVDGLTITHPEHPVLVVDLRRERGRTFRAIPSQVQGIENNLSIANMDFAEFADAAGADGIFRGFPEP